MAAATAACDLGIGQRLRHVGLQYDTSNFSTSARSWRPALELLDRILALLEHLLDHATHLGVAQSLRSSTSRCFTAASSRRRADRRARFLGPHGRFHVFVDPGL